MSKSDVFERATNAFYRARRKAFLNKAMRALQGRSNELLPYDEVREKLHVGGPVYKGLQTVPIDQIVGSVDRYRDFDRAFLPSQTFTQARWQSIGRAFYQEVSLPPVMLYRVGDVYFVVDGNHRVSVARELGQKYVDAEVQECEIRVPVTADIQPEDIEIIGEKADFLSRTHLDELCPDVQLDMTIAGGYRVLLEHIAVHRYFRSVEWSREISDEEAASSWCKEVYLPLVDVIHWSGILKDFPARTETDLYLWVIEHLHYLREQFGDRVSLDDAARDYAQHFTARFFKRLWHQITHLLAMSSW